MLLCWARVGVLDLPYTSADTSLTGRNRGALLLLRALADTMKTLLLLAGGESSDSPGGLL